MSSPPDDTAMIHLKVGHEVFVTTMATLKQSPMLAAKFSERWNASTPSSNGNGGPPTLFLEADPEVFRYILDFLRHGQTPLLWDVDRGFDLIKYAAIYQMAKYYGIHDLTVWIQQRK